MTKLEITAKIARLEGPCNLAFRAGRDAEIARLREMLADAPDSETLASDDGLQRWDEVQKRDVRADRQVERRGFSD